MKVTSRELQTIYRRQPTRAELNRADCLPEELLARAGRSELSDSERLHIADHLTTCQDCAADYKLVRAVKAWATETAALPAIETAASPATETAASPEASEADAIELNPPEAETIEVENDTIGTPPKWWHDLIPRFIGATGFNLFTATVAALFLITSLSLATWLVALHFKHKAELTRVSQQPIQTELVASAEPVDPEILQARIEEAQKQLTDVQTQLGEQNADRVLSNQELLGIQNSALQKEMDELAKPQLDAPIIDLDPSKLPRLVDPTAFTTIEVPPTAALFTVILHKPADKIYPSYLLELLDAKKPKPLWSGMKKSAPEPMTMTLSLLRRNYPSGKYRIRLSGVEGKKREPIETYNLEVKYAPPPKAAKKKR